MSLTRLGRMSVAGQAPAQADDVRGRATDTPAPAKDRLDGITKYVPVETITLFVAAMSVLTAVEAVFSGFGKWQVYWACAALTPLIVWLAAIGQHIKEKSAGGWPLPWWRMLAATIAFLVWSLSIPPMLDDAQRPLAGLGALLVSILLTLGDPILDTPAQEEG